MLSMANLPCPLPRPTGFEWQYLTAFDQTEQATLTVVNHISHLLYSRPINKPSPLDGNYYAQEHWMMSPYHRAMYALKAQQPVRATFTVVA